MRKKFYSWATLVLFVGLAGFAFAQTPTAVIKIEGYSPQELHDMGWTSPRSTGLSVVGVGQVVYLLGNANATSWQWTLTSKPAGSTAALDSATKRQTTFKPDVEGKFTVSLVINGTSAPASVTITSAKFVGVGGMDGLPTQFPQCGVCHSTPSDQKFQEWSKTKHSKFFTEAIDGLKSSHYNEACIECHTTGWDDSPGAVNDGFDDVAKELGWKFPDTLKAGNWAALKANFPKLAARANIQCESCHGPGSQHNAMKSGIAMSLDEAACGYCHDEEPYHRKSMQWKNSVHGIPNPTFEGVANRPVSSGCNKCHSGWGFIRRIDPKTNDTRPEIGFSQISCAVCHDPHRSELLPSQVRSLANVQLGDTVSVVTYGGMGKVCMQCHIGRRPANSYVDNPGNLSIHFGPHYSNQADMLDGSNAIEYGLPTGSSGHKFAVENSCVTCHMQATPAAPSPARDKVGEHTYAMTWDGGTPDNPVDDFQHVAVCKTCHGPIKSFDDIMAKADWDDDGSIEPTRHEIEGLLHRLDELLPPNSTPDEVNTNYKWAATDPPAKIEARKLLAKAWFNFRFVEEDRSMGVHNAGYAITLLRRSIASLTTGDIGAAEIISITDVPNDQGKQVRLAWDGFPGDGVSSDPVTNYSLWRRVDNVAGKAAGLAVSKAELLAQAKPENVGKRFNVAQSGWWDFVGIVPAVQNSVYSTVVPTLFDSTSAGIVWSYFFVAGHRRSGQTLETAPDSGYSVDNLAPFAPSNFALSVLNNKVGLRWADPVDEDFQYFAVYRGTTANFDPKGTKPLATIVGTNFTDTDVKIGDKYYYTVSAFDFAGNESKYPQALLANITSVEEKGGGVPTAYALEQNYPNPFNPETTIKYQLPGASHVRLSVYTALGQEIRLLVDYSQPAAYHQVVWDGRDNAGNLMPSGVYFYRLVTDKYTAMKKMVMMK
jgi:hypothetical protein